VRLRDGTLAAAAELDAEGTSELALVRGLEGSGSLEMEGGTIEGLDLATPNARLASGARVDLFTLLRAATSGGETKIKHLAGSFSVEGGLAETKDLTIEAEGGRGKGEARLNLPDWYLEFATGFTLAAAADAPPFYIRLKGPPDAPRKFLDANAFQEWLSKRQGAAAAARPARKAPPTPATSSSDSIIEDLLKEPQKTP